MRMSLSFRLSLRLLILERGGALVFLGRFGFVAMPLSVFVSRHCMLDNDQGRLSSTSRN